MEGGLTSPVGADARWRESTDTRDDRDTQRDAERRHGDAMTASSELGGEYVGQLRAEIDSLAGTGQYPHAQRLLYQGKTRNGLGGF